MGNKLSAKRLRRLVERGDEANALRLIAEAHNRGKTIDLTAAYAKHDDLTILHLAALMGMPQLVRLCLDTDGIDVNAVTSDSRRTPLHFVSSPEKMLLSQFAAPDRARLANVRSAITNILAVSTLGRTRTRASTTTTTATVSVTSTSDGSEYGSEDGTEPWELVEHPDPATDAAADAASDSRDEDEVEDEGEPEPVAVSVEDALQMLDGRDRALYAAAVAKDAANREVLELLLAVDGLDVNAETVDGVTPLHQVAYDGYAYGLDRLLLMDGIDTNRIDRFGNTALHQAALRGFEHGVEALIPLTSDIQARNNRGRTPLECAASHSHWEIVRMLLSAGSAVLPGSALDGGLNTLRVALDGILGRSDTAPSPSSLAGRGADVFATADSVFDFDDDDSDADDAPPETPAGLRRLGRSWAYRVHVAGSDGGASSSDEDESEDEGEDAAYDEGFAAFPAVTATDTGPVSALGMAARQVALDMQEIGDERDARIASVVTALSVSPAAALALLQTRAWDVTATTAWYLQDPARACDSANILDQEQLRAAAELRAQTSMCLICMDNIDAASESALSATDCEHMFCRSCWTSYVQVALDDNNVRRLTCPGVGCGAVVPDATVAALLSPGDYQRYLALVVQAYVDEDPRTKWCPAPDCGMAVEAPPEWVVPLGTGAGDGAGASNAQEEPRLLKANVRDAMCGRGHSFCFSCGEAPHEPASCSMMSRWRKAVDDYGGGTEYDDRSRRWMLNHAKPCFHCGRFTERNQGCSHMTCRVNQGGCGGQWCWNCGGNWSGHTSASCRREKRNLARRIRERAAELTIVKDERLDEARLQIAAHALSEAHEIQLVAGIDRVADILQSVAPHHVSVHFVRVAGASLLRARSTLKHVYIRRYFMQDNIDTRAFEHTVATLERHTDALTIILSIPFHLEGSEWSPADNIALLRYAVFAYMSRARIHRLTQLVDSSRRNVLEVAHMGHAAVRVIDTPRGSHGSRSSPGSATPTPGQALSRECAACHYTLPRSSFSKTQWRRGSRRRCTTCILVGRSPEPGPSRPLNANATASASTSRAGDVFASDYDGHVSRVVHVTPSSTKVRVRLPGQADDTSSEDAEPDPRILRRRASASGAGLPTWIFDPITDKWIKTSSVS